MRLAISPQSAIAVAGLMAWAAIGLELWSGPLAATTLGALFPVHGLSRSLHAVFLLVFLASIGIRGHDAVQLALAATLSAITLALVALYRYNSAAALLIVPMLAFARLLNVRMLTAVYVALNALLLTIVLMFRQMDAPLTYVSLHASLQLFAIMVARFAQNAEHARNMLASAHAELLTTRGMLAESARHQERLRLSRELHDVAGHKLTALRLNLAAITHNRHLDQAAAVVLCSRLTEELLDDLRGVVHQLRLHDGLELGATLHRLAAPFPRPRVLLDIADDARVATLDQAEALLRTFQEGLTNAARHGDAAHVWATLSRDGDQVRLVIRDDGRGRAPVRAGHGLSGMRERLQALGGDLEFERAGDTGFHLSAWLPIAWP
ncbi:sensor histidine kinase [Dyella koreensis]|uniref:Sensor histidine kinase n=1 Tax=Dyella koreensis TaxID=311235 RepID=A0ABW8K4X6_9GAMM